MRPFKTNWAVRVSISILLLAVLAFGYTCPYNKYYARDYSSITTSPTEKYVAEDIAITITDFTEEGDSYPAVNRLVEIYYTVDSEIVSEFNLYTDAGGVASFTPEESGTYTLISSGRNIFFEVKSRCGDGRCNANENRANCPQDCARCGDGVCDINEDKRSCPKDCIICGDDSCDTGENRANCPQDCARCGDGVCDKNENKESCAEDCVICGDGVCDIPELVSLHNTTCPEDCIICGDGFCDFPEDCFLCPQDCIICGDGSCDLDENVTCPRDCDICGDGSCGISENKSNCIEDCSICGDGVCDLTELVTLHQTVCPEDCHVCGDEICDHGETKNCPKDCEKSLFEVFKDYFWVLLLIVAIAVILEVAHSYAAKIRAPKPEKPKLCKKPKKLTVSDLKSSAVFLLLFSIILLSAIWLLSISRLTYVDMLSVFDYPSLLANNGPLLVGVVLLTSLLSLPLIIGTCGLDRTRASLLTIPFSFLGVLPGLLFLQSIEFLMAIMGIVVGTCIAVFTIRTEGEEYKVSKPFKIGSEAVQKILSFASLFLVITAFFALYLSPAFEDIVSDSLWRSEITRETIRANLGPTISRAEVGDLIVKPFFDIQFGPIDGRLIMACGAALLLSGVLKIFSILCKLLAGFLVWSLEKFELLSV
ncbi:MAG: hypothetical protein JXB14_05485 [Candidatus Altiarchaeota archaeon]|nr:hypothetical protein [Candidatus Altiarchaeota archaeon]